MNEFNERHIFNKLPDYITVNNQLNNLQRYSISHSISREMLNDFNYHLNVELYINDILSNEIVSHIQKLIFKKENYKNNYYFLDARNKSESDISDNLFYLISSYRNKVLLSSPKIVQLLSSHPIFNHVFSHSAGIGNLTSVVGHAGNTKVIVNNLLKYDDNFISLFDGVEVSLKVDQVRIVDEATFSPRTVVDVLFDYNIINSKILYLIEDKDSEFYSEFLLQSRDEKINKIINQ